METRLIILIFFFPYRYFKKRQCSRTWSNCVSTWYRAARKTYEVCNFMEFKWKTLLYCSGDYIFIGYQNSILYKLMFQIMISKPSVCECNSHHFILVSGCAFSIVGRDIIRKAAYRRFTQYFGGPSSVHRSTHEKALWTSTRSSSSSFYCQLYATTCLMTKILNRLIHTKNWIKFNSNNPLLSSYFIPH